MSRVDKTRSAEVNRVLVTHLRVGVNQRLGTLGLDVVGKNIIIPGSGLGGAVRLDTGKVVDSSVQVPAGTVLSPSYNPLNRLIHRRNSLGRVLFGAYSMGDGQSLPIIASKR